MRDFDPYSFRRILDESPYSDQEIAEAVGVSHTTVYRWRNGDSDPAFAHVQAVHEFHAERVSELRDLTLNLKSDLEKLAGIATGGYSENGR